MKCKEVQEMLPACQDGELSAENEKTVRTHLEGCAICRKEEQLLSASWDMLSELKPIVPSPGFEARFWAKVRQMESKQTGWRSWLGERPLMPATIGLAGMAAVWVIGVSGGVMLFGNHGRSEAPLLSPSSVYTSPYPANSIEQVFMQK